MGINVLPAEILGHILAIYAEDAFERLTADRLCWMLVPDSLYIPQRSEKFHGFLNTTLVRKRWREIALHCPAFWSNIVVGPRENTDRMLARSKDRPLDVFCMLRGYVDRYRRRDAFWLALNRLERFHSFRLCCEDTGEIITPLYASAHAPLLEDLTAHFAEVWGRPVCQQPCHKSWTEVAGFPLTAVQGLQRARRRAATGIVASVAVQVFLGASRVVPCGNVL